MIVKIGNKFVNSNDEPIMVIMNKEEQNLIANMVYEEGYTGYKFCSYPEEVGPAAIEEFITIKAEDMLPFVDGESEGDIK